MSDLGDYVNSNISKALKSRQKASASQEVRHISGPSEEPDVSGTYEVPDSQSGKGIVGGGNDPSDGTKNALKQRQKKNTVETYSAIDPGEKY